MHPSRIVPDPDGAGSGEFATASPTAFHNTPVEPISMTRQASVDELGAPGNMMMMNPGGRAMSSSLSMHDSAMASVGRVVKCWAAASSAAKDPHKGGSSDKGSSDKGAVQGVKKLVLKDLLQVRRRCLCVCACLNSLTGLQAQLLSAVCMRLVARCVGLWAYVVCCSHTRTLTHTYTQCARAHTHTHTHSHTHAHTQSLTHTHTCTHTYFGTAGHIRLHRLCAPVLLFPVLCVLRHYRGRPLVRVHVCVHVRACL